MLPKVSVLMSVYNREDYVGEAIESILNQTFVDFEFLIVDDGSTDSTFDVLLKYEKQDPRVRIIKNERNLGISASINKALDLAQGEYIARMDSDDISIRERLEFQVCFLDAHPEIIICGGELQYFGVNSQYLSVPISDQEIRLQAFLSTPFAQVTVMFRRKTILQNNLRYDESLKVSEDYDLWGKILKLGKGQNLNKVLVYSRTHETNVSFEKKDLMVKMAHDVRRKYLFENLTLEFSQSEISSICNLLSPYAVPASKFEFELGERFFDFLESRLGSCSLKFRNSFLDQISQLFTTICVRQCNLGFYVLNKALRSNRYYSSYYPLYRLLIKIFATKTGILKG